MPKNETKPTIAVDIDEVLFPMAPTFLEYHNTKYGTELRIDQMKSYYVEELTGETFDQMQQKIQAYLATEHYKRGRPVDGSVEAIKKLRERYKLALVTSRNDFYRGSTELFLETHFGGLYDELHYTHTVEQPEIRISKTIICHQIGAIAMIDDHIDHLRDCARHGIQGILFGDYPWNQGLDPGHGILRVRNWPEVLEHFNAKG